MCKSGLKCSIQTNILHYPLELEYTRTHSFVHLSNGQLQVRYKRVEMAKSQMFVVVLKSILKGHLTVYLFFNFKCPIIPASDIFFPHFL